MKQTGVVRKIDELGRIVLPKEIRRNLGIRDGESMEIFVDEKGVYLQKFSKVSDLKEFGVLLCQDVLEVMGLNLILLDYDKIVASFDKKIYGSDIPVSIYSLMDNREGYESKFRDTFFSLNGYFLMRPLIVNADCLGLIVLYKADVFEKWEKNFLSFLEHLMVRKIEI